jgi:GntR family transcriptional regulator / MocR family aminotransferase
LLLAKARPYPIPVDAQGLVVEAGLRTEPRARAAFVTPSHQFPTGVALAVARRLELLARARQRGAFIVEDDSTSEFRYSGPPLASLQGLDDAEQVIYVGTLNQALFPELRIGYAVVPRAAAGFCKRALSHRSPTCDAAASGRFRVHATRPFRRRTFVACASFIANSATRWQRR